MTRQTSRIAGAIAFAAFIAYGTFATAQEKPKIQQTTITHTVPTDAKEMYTSYCAACHGIDGKGNGPAAKALTKAPADLTQLSAKNGGKFPDIRVRRYIEGADEVPAHGSRDMPIWGNLFKHAGGGTEGVPIRVRNLSDYIQSLQK